MAKIKFSLKEIEKHIRVNEKTIETINMFGTPAEKVGDELEVEIFPNRPDLISMHGFLRAIKAYLGEEKGIKKYKINKPEENFEVTINENLEEIRPYTACSIVKGIKFDDAKIKEIIDLQEKLHSTICRNRKKAAIGIYPLEKIKLPIKFEARNPVDIKFIPLGMNIEMNGLQILQRHPTGRDYSHLLNGMEKFPVFIDSNNKILSMPPIINSDETGKITEDTKEIFIECSGFNLETLNKILNIIVTTLADMGGKIYSMKINRKKESIITPNMTPSLIKISQTKLNNLLGLNIKEKEIEKLAEKMGLEYKSRKIKIPAWRSDIIHEVDIIEDIAIAYGYDKIIPKIPWVATIAEENKESRFFSQISSILIGLGLVETSTYHLIKPEEAELTKENKIELENSKTEFKFLRQNLLIPNLRILSENKDNEYPQKIFEIGKVFSHSKEKDSETGIKEKDNLAILLTPGNFTEIKQILEYLAKMLSINYSLEYFAKENLIEGRTGKIIVKNNAVGYIGEVHPRTLKILNINNPVSAIELSLTELHSILNN